MQGENFLRNWELLKPLILRKWKKLDEADLEEAQAVVPHLVEVIQAKYPELPKESIVQELENLGQQILKNP